MTRYLSLGYSGYINIAAWLPPPLSFSFCPSRCMCTRNTGRTFPFRKPAILFGNLARGRRSRRRRRFSGIPTRSFRRVLHWAERKRERERERCVRITDQRKIFASFSYAIFSDSPKRLTQVPIARWNSRETFCTESQRTRPRPLAPYVRNYNITGRRNDDYHDAREKRKNRRRERTRKRQRERDRRAGAAREKRKEGHAEVRSLEAAISGPSPRATPYKARRSSRSNSRGRSWLVHGRVCCASNLRASDNRRCTAWVTSKHLRGGGATSREAAQFPARDGLSDGAVSRRCGL